MELLQKGLVCCYGNPFDFMVRFELDLESQFLVVRRIVSNDNWDVEFSKMSDKFGVNCCQSQENLVH